VVEIGKREQTQHAVSVDMIGLSASELLATYDLLGDTAAWVKDTQFQYRWANRTFLLNHSLSDLSELVGKTDQEISPAYLADLYQSDDASVLNGQTIVARVEPVGTYEAMPRWNQTWKRPLHDGKGNVVAAFGLSRQLPETNAPEFPFSDLVPVLNHMRTHTARQVTNRELAQLAHLSVRAFERKFKRHIKMTPAQFIGRLRITRAAADLCDTTDAINEIAYRHGFSDQSHLTREFRKHFGKTPKSYRSTYQG
tara:strand:+ start:67119 stop:67877 length:759 start_codon:yes stop_codon:yes gene_type:complete